jgi:hypothetical protein
MDKQSFKFETSKAALLGQFLLPVLFALIFSVLIGAGTWHYLISELKSSPEETEKLQHMFMSSMGWALSTLGVIYGIFTFIYINKTAYKIRIGENSLDISTFSQEHTLRWTEIAQVQRLVYHARTYLYVKTWDAQAILVSPPLKPLDELEKELKARALDAVDAPPRPGQRPLDERKRELFYAGLHQGWLQLLSIVGIAGALFGGFQIWQLIRDPEIEIMGWSESPLALGKKMWVDTYPIYNYGREAHGIEVEVSGDAFEKQWLKNPVVLIESQDETRLSFPHPIKNQTRELLTLLPKGKGVWAATSKSAVLKQTDFLLFEALSTVTSGLRRVDRWEHHQNITLFADVLKKGKGKVIFKVAAVGLPAVQATTEASTTIENDGRATPIASVGVPSDFPVTAYPDSQIDLLSAWDIKLYSTASDKEIIAFYKKELKRKGWHTVETPGDSKQTKLLAKKDKDKLTIETSPMKEGTQIELLRNFP